MKIAILNRQTDLSIDELSVAPVVQFLLEKEEASTDELTIHFVSEEEISQLHGRFFNDPSSTDCISFPMDQREKTPYHILGELFVCPKVAIHYVQNHPDSLHDPHTEVTLYLIHALLHLLGYQDEEEKPRQIMHALQEKYLHDLVQKKMLLYHSKKI